MRKTIVSNRSSYILGIIVISLIGIILVAPLTFYDNEGIYLNNKNYEYNDFNLKSASNGLKPLNYSSIYQNTTLPLNRLFESIYFRVNISGFSEVDYTIMQISYQNGMFKNFSMSVLNEDEFEYTYTPEYNAPLGFHRVNFYIFNATDVLLNSHTTYVNFTIISNYIGSLDNVDYNRGEMVNGEFKIIDYDLHTFTWELSLVDNLNESLETTLFTLGNNIEYFYFETNESFSISNYTYYVKITVTDTYYSKVDRIYFPFMLLNSLPEIIPASINFSSYEVKREMDCTITLNVTDGDMDIDTFPENISVRITLQDSLGIKNTPTFMTNNGDWTFKYTFLVAASKPIGSYQVIFEALDQYMVQAEPYIKTITVENNLPEIYGFTINDINVEESISINYGDDIKFKFNVSDVEDTISFITVHLLNQRNEWFNLTVAYYVNVELVVRTVDLISGSWYVYITVYDSDGGITSLTSDYGFAPKEIRIIPDVLTPILPWIALIIGVILGLLGGLAIIYKFFKSKFSEPKELIKKKKKLKETKVKEPPKIKERSVEIDEEEPQKELREQKPVQRKIKRRLK